MKASNPILKSKIVILDFKMGFEALRILTFFARILNIPRICVLDS